MAVRTGDGAHAWRGALLAAADDSEAGETFRGWFSESVKIPLRHILAEQALKGAVRRDWDIDLATELLFGPIWHRLIAMRGPVPGSLFAAAGGERAEGARRGLGGRVSPRLVFRDLGAADDHVVDLIRTIGKAQVAHVGIEFSQRRPLRDAGGAVDLDRLVDDAAGDFRIMDFTIDTQTRASLLPSTSIALAAFSTIRRICSMS